MTAVRTAPTVQGTNTATMQAWSSTMRLVVGDATVLRPAATDLAVLLDRIDRLASRFRPDSDLSRANALVGRPVPIPRLLTALVAAALDAAEQTGGAVDPTVGATMRRLGYDRDISDLPELAPEPEPADRLTAARNWRDVRLDRDAGLLMVPRGVELDLGATAKAYVADHAAHALASRYDTAVMVELGGDIAVAGDQPGGWCITVAERRGEPGQDVLVRHGGLTTSTTTIRSWRRGDRAMHHIVDPRTGAPADGPWRTVSVYAPCALAANTASTAAIVLGEQALPWLSTRNLAARLVAHTGEVRTVGDWPTPEAVAA